jgi:hypothetical protein
MSAHPIADHGADVFDPPGRDPWAQFDRLRKRPGLNPSAKASLTKTGRLRE